MTAPLPRDPGLQPERTALSWRRTLLTMAGGSLLMLRLLPTVAGPVGLLAGLAGLAAVAALWTGTRRRLRQYETLMQAQPARLDGRWLLGVAVVVSAFAVVALSAVA